ncbi:mediator of rna polymerase ii transcription subunit 16 [Diplodia corticola]|uniref:Mediator of RNA polymerase II transcription subunit 16 n=1 Tax=Diplodia corticola TaxID=236234 RepID=A0A1J9RAN5_9PEZI|nr:mediator of rna polymerase ii transcription subunit 16 [Diplodia corticola]OJD37608.1 mediator of rna polymerase ii transcription subunit 16 [Diplodia corticola]
MDDDQYMDLFNEAEQLPIAVQTPPVKRLAQRLDELGESGCCQKIAWSKSGCVASITRDGRGVNLRAFQRNPVDGKWILGDEAPLHIPSVHEEFPLVHVAWGHLGVDLAVVDAAGRILVYTAAQAADRMKLSREPFSDHESESNALVGLHWLPVAPQQVKYHMIWSGDRNEDKWQYRMTSHPWKEPHNPIHPRMSLGAFICFTRGGTVRLLFQQPDQQWYEATAEVEASNSGKDAFSHASFTSDSENSLLLATHTVAGSVLVYRVKINWNAQPGKSASPTFDIAPLKAEDDCSPLATNFDASASVLGSTQNLSFPARLTHLSFIPIGPDPGPSPSHPTVMAVFCHTPAPVPSLMDQTHSQQPPFSIISRWELHGSSYALHSGFEQLTAKKKAPGSAGQRQKMSFKRLPDIVLDSATLGLFNLDSYTKLALYQSNGGVEFRDRYTMDVITADSNENRISSLPQAGFSFPASDPALHMVLSPSACMLALLQPDGTITLKNMEFNHGSLNDGGSDPKTTAAIAALVLQYSSASLQYMPGDDLFAIMPPDLNHNLKRLFLRGTHLCMNVVADYPPEDTAQKPFENIFRNNVLRGCLSTQNLLGMATNGSRDLSSKLAWTTLNLRFTSFLLSIPTNHARGGGPESFTMETAKSVKGLLRWTMDLMVYMVNDLIELSQECRKHEADRGFVQKKLQERCSPGLFLLLCSFPRSIFRVTRQPLQLLLTISQWHIKNAPTVIHRSVFNGLLAAMISSPVHPPHMAALVLEVDNQVRLCYNKAQYTDERRRATEREMLISAEIPDVLMPVVTRLLTQGMDKLLDTVDAAKIMYWDLRWLGLSEDKREKQYLEKNTVDVLRKVEISRKDSGRRRCVRCGGEMEDMDWMGGQNKCACGCPWAMGSLTKKS